jgi:hypothetical protein
MTEEEARGRQSPADTLPAVPGRTEGRCRRGEGDRGIVKQQGLNRGFIVVIAADLIEFEIPERIRQAFAGRTYLNQTELADALEMNIKTVARHMNEGNLKYTEVGTGKIRPRRKSTLSQVCAFLLNQSRGGCESNEALGRVTGSSYPKVHRFGTGAASTKVAGLEARRAILGALARSK